jgi:cobalt-zinc-cadmium efflux system outer membrane protein
MKQNIEIRNKKQEAKSMKVSTSLSIVNCQLSILIVLLVTLASSAQVLTLDSVLSAVEKRNPILETYRNRAHAANAYVAGSKSQMAPEVGGGLWMFPYKKQNYEHLADTRQIMLSVQQTFTNPAKLRSNEKYLSSRAAIENAGTQVAYNELKAQAKNAYYQWYVFEKKSKSLKESEEIVTMIIKIAQLRYPYNQAKLSSIYMAEARLHEIHNMQLMNENEIHHEKTLLSQLMDIPHEHQYTIDSTSIAREFSVAEVDTSFLLTSRSDLHRLEYSIQSLRYGQEQEKSMAKPDFNISFNHMISLGEGMPNQFMLLGMVTIPIAPWSSKMYKSNQKAMEYEISAMNSERLAILNEVQGMTTSMVAEIHTLKKQLENYETRIIPALKKNYDALMLAYEENNEELPMVIDGWETLNMTQLQYLDTLGKYYEMIVNYEKEIEK